MPSIFPPRNRWIAATLPLPEAGLDSTERIQRLIAGSLTLWSSRIVGFRWDDHPSSAIVYRYCVARINSERHAPRPTVAQLRECVAEVGDKLDVEGYRALNSLVYSAELAVRDSAPPSRAYQATTPSILDSRIDGDSMHTLPAALDQCAADLRDVVQRRRHERPT